MIIKKKVNKIVGKVVNLVTNTVSQTSNNKGEKNFEPAEGIDKACRQAAAEGMVLLKNDKNVLPLAKDSCTAFFGRVQYDTFFVGYGSGGDVNAHYNVSYIDGIKNCKDITPEKQTDELYHNWCKKNPVDNGYWGHWPMSYDEMPLTDSMVLSARKNADTAVFFIGRAAGEDRENTLTKGSYYLTDTEENCIKLISRHFEKFCVVLNIGSIFDFSWVEKYNVPCALIAWQGGMEAGNALADVLSGNISPCGKLTDTIAVSYDSYPSAFDFGNKKKNVYTEDIFVGYRYFETFFPDKVLFPFGHGLGYSDFSANNILLNTQNGQINISADILNTGNCPAKQVVELYCAMPQGKLPTEKLRLVSFAKTNELMPGEKETVNFCVNKYELSAYDDEGLTGNKSAYVLQNGSYEFFIGYSVRELFSAGVYTQNETEIIKQLSEVSAVQKEEQFMRLTTVYYNGKAEKSYSPVPTKTTDLKQIILNNLPSAFTLTGDNGYKLIDVKENKVTMEQFVAQLNLTELEAITRGDYVMNSPLGPKGNASVYAGVLPSLREKGVPPLTCTDGPSGIRLAASSALLPSGTSLACTWNTELVNNVYALLAKEMKERGSNVLLAPGMNIHRNPLCGRNFEYYSEDPVVSGLIAAATVNGLQSEGASASIKHFCCNNQETKRTTNNSVLSERALREIYLKGFEICINKSSPKNLMTSYNKINGVWGHYNYELVTTVLRGEWGYKGCVMTDWWMQSSVSPEFCNLRNQAYRVRAQVDVLMPGGARTGKRKPDGTLLESYDKPDGITLGELQRSAINVLNYAITTL